MTPHAEMHEVYFLSMKEGSYFFVAKKVSKAKARFQRKPTPFSRVSWLIKTMNIRKVKYSKFKGVKLPLQNKKKFKKGIYPVRSWTFKY